MPTIKEWKRDFLKLPKWAKVTIFITIISAVPILFIPFQCYQNKKQYKEAKEDRGKILEGIELILKREKKDAAPEIIENEAQKTYEIARNFNANFLIKKGYEKTGGMGTWFIPIWKEHPQHKFYLIDFVGNLDKNRISIFITEENLLICQVLTSDGRKEDLSVDISSWKENVPHLIIVQWQTEKDRVQLFVKNEYVKIIPDLKFDVLGPIIFVGIDFEGKFPARFKRGGPSILKGLESVGFKEYKQK